MSRSGLSLRAMSCAVLLPWLGACGEGPEARRPAPRDTIELADAPPIPDPAARDTVLPDPVVPVDSQAWTAGVVDLPSAVAGMGMLTSVRAARHDGFDRVVWELAGATPGVHVEYVDAPVRQCGSGEAVSLPGDGWLEVRLEPARAHTEEGRPTMAARRQAPALPVVEEMVQTCDFEAVVTWILATRSPEPFRLTLLDEPPRVVVDVRHDSL